MNKKLVVIGASVLTALVVLYFGIEFLKGANIFQPSNYYFVNYNNVNGLTVSSPVTVNGFKVGLVKDVQYDYDNPGNVIVELELDDKLKLPKGTKAMLTTDMLGTASVVLDMADAKEFYAPGDKIQGEVAAGLMDNLSNDMLPAFSGVMSKVDSLLASLNAVVGNQAVINSVQRLDAITANLEATTSQLATLTRSLSPAMANVDEITSNLSVISANLAVLSAELKELPIDSTMTNVYEVTENVRVLTDKLNNSDSSLGLLLNDNGLYNSLNGAVGSLDSLLIDIKNNPKRYISIKLL